MSASAFNLNSSAARRWIAVSSRRTSVRWPLKSKRCPISRSVCWTALSTSWRSTRHTTSKDGIGGPSIGGWLDHVNPGRRREPEQRRVERRVSLLVRKRDPRRRPERVGDARLLDRRILLRDREAESPDPGVLPRHELQHPALGLVALQRSVEVAVEAPEPGEKRDGRRRVERLPERRFDHLLLRRLVDPERRPVADDQLLVGRRVAPPHPVRLLERDRAVGGERR